MAITFEEFRKLPLKKRMDEYKNNPEFVRKNIRGNLEDIYFDYVMTNSSEEKFRKEIFEIGYVDYAASTRENIFARLSQIEQLRTDRNVGKGRNKSTYFCNTTIFDDIQDQLMMIFAKHVSPDIFLLSGQTSRITLAEAFAIFAYKSLPVRKFCVQNGLDLQHLSNFYKTILRLDDRSLKAKYNRICAEEHFKAEATKFIPKISSPSFKMIELVNEDVENTFGISLTENKIFKIIKETGAVTIAMENLSSELVKLGAVPKRESKLLLNSLKKTSFNFSEIHQ